MSLEGWAGDHLEQYRELRSRLEANILPLATSVDGRSFDFQAPLHGLVLPPGGYAILEHGTGERLAQVLSVRLDHTDAAEVGWEGSGDGPGIRSRLVIRRAVGAGRVLSGDGQPFHDAVVRAATPEEVAAWVNPSPPAQTDRARLEVGELRLAPGVGFSLDAGGFDRHTFFCGQSGSGKTYSLGVVLEQLLLETGLQLVILDPNSDFSRLDTVRDGVDEPTAQRWRALAGGISIRSGPEGPGRVHLRLDQLSRPAQAALLQLDPVADREEYAELGALLEEERPRTFDQWLDSERPGARELALRVRNLGVERWPVWSRGSEGSVIDALSDPAVRCLVIDLGSLGGRGEQALVAEAVLSTLWERRAERRPVLIVIDEAHNVCPAEPEDALRALAAEHAVRIAAEGRKFGLYLLVCTQRPQKVQQNVIAQCDNLVLMRMASEADLAYTGEVLSYVPRDLLAGATSFRLGEALVAGKLASHPALIKFGRRVAEEGGSDVEAAWAAAR
jgi:Helicase HerA, central domain